MNRIYEDISLGTGASVTIYKNILTKKFSYILYEIPYFMADPVDYPVLETDSDGTFDTAMDAIHDAADKALELSILFYNPETFNLRGER